MKLLVCWSKNSKYHSLLIREKEDKTPLYHVFATLGAPGVSSDVSAVIMQLTINLLSLSDEEVIQSIEASKELDYKRYVFVAHMILENPSKPFQPIEYLTRRLLELMFERLFFIFVSISHVYCVLNSFL